MKKILCAAVALLLLTCCSNGPGAGASSAGESAPELSASVSAAPESEPESAAGASSVSESDAYDEPGASDAGLSVVKITVPEGYTLARIAMLLEEKEICTADEFIDTANRNDWSAYPLIAEQAPDTNRCFALEGYLFPDTYEFYSPENPDVVLSRMLENTEQRIGAELRAEIAKSGYTVDEILAMASIIEKEAFGDEQMPLISSVLHNRLDTGMQLQCDVTITYVEGAIKPFITGDKDRFSADYNTYKCAALPAGAICNPGLAAIKAALRPETTDYLFFVTDAGQNYYYSATWDEHEQNVARIRQAAESSPESSEG